MAASRTARFAAGVPSVMLTGAASNFRTIFIFPSELTFISVYPIIESGAARDKCEASPAPGKNPPRR
jgi:hypothetical protein